MKRKVKRICKTIALTLLTSVATTFPLVQASDDDLTSNDHKNYIFGTFFTSNDDITMQCYLSESENGDDLKYFSTIEDIKGRDISCQYYNGYFYICLVEPKTSENTFRLYRSKDLKEWEISKPYKVVERDVKYRFIWAPDLFINDDGLAYVYFAKQKGLIPKPYEAQFNLYVYKIENIAESDKFFKLVKDEKAEKNDENEKVNEAEKAKKTEEVEKPIIDGKEAVTVFEKSINDRTNYIDAQVRKVNGKYYMVIKNEARITNNDNKSPILFRADSPDGKFTEVKEWPLRGIRGYEGFSILTRDGRVYIYADNFSQKYDNAGKSGHTVWIANENDIENGPYKAYYVEAENRPLRHGSLINLDDEAIKILGVKEFFDEKQKSENVNANEDNQSKSTNTNPKEVKLTKEDFELERNNKNKKVITISNFAPAQDVKYIIPSKMKVDIKNIVNPYGVEKITFVFNDKSELVVDGQKHKPVEKNECTLDIGPNGEIRDTN
ncbi:MAG: hypothetical protein IJ862_03865 [Selenomonadaceae bacterium]|nr:hypothetical protein [Selenomonadaceae bacterium]